MIRFPQFPIARWTAVDWWALPLRLIVGYGFMEHGWAKLSRGSEHFAGILAALGLPAPDLLAWSTIVFEIVGGLAVLIGFAIPLFSVPMIFILLVAIVTVHIPNGFSSIKLLAVTVAGAQFGQPGYETDLLYMACLIALVMGGPGPFAIDNLIDGQRCAKRPIGAGNCAIALTHEAGTDGP